MRRRPPPAEQPAGPGVLLDPRAPVWRDRDRVTEAARWAEEHGLRPGPGGGPDWDALRVLLDGPEALRSAARRSARRTEAADGGGGVTER